MQIQPINSKNNKPQFNGFLKVNNALREFKMSLNDVQQDIFENSIMRIEKEDDGRVFKYDKIEGTNFVGIFEKFNHPLAKPWGLLIQAPKEKAAWCFDQLSLMYKQLWFAKLDKFSGK